MDNEKIKELAQSCAEACLERYASMQDSEIAKEYSDVMETAIRTILETHCIIEKKSVAEWVNDIEFFMPDKRSVTMLKIGAKSLFGKELFNTTEK